MPVMADASYLSAGVTDASMKALMSLLCQLNNLPMMIDKTTNMGLKQGVDAICEWLDNGVKKARLRTSAPSHLAHVNHD